MGDLAPEDIFDLPDKLFVELSRKLRREFRQFVTKCPPAHALNAKGPRIYRLPARGDAGKFMRGGEPG